MNKLKTLLSLSLLLLASLSSYSQYFSRVHEEYKIVEKDCRMLIYSIILNNLNNDPTDDKLIGTYSVLIGNACMDFNNIPAEIEFVKSKNVYHITVVTSQSELQPKQYKNSLEAEKITPSCILITTDFWDDNGTFESKKDDIRLGNHHLTIWSVDGEFVGNDKILDLMRSKGYNIEYSINGN
ncbi:MAG: hypothetical protein IPI60_19610 [Saprospiraceae bacterium]|nr:hypothetical protein [Saprospiraceae bacterium]